MKRTMFLLVILLVLVAPAAAQTSTDCGLETRLMQGRHATTLTELAARDNPGFDNPSTAIIPAGTLLGINDIEPQCIDGARWWQITDGSNLWQSWIPESQNGQYLVEPFKFTPAAPIPFDIPLKQPIMTNSDVPLPTVTPASNPESLSTPYAQWDWAKFMENSYWLCYLQKMDRNRQ